MIGEFEICQKQPACGLCGFLISSAYALGHPLYPVLKYVFAARRIWAPQSLRQWMLEGFLEG
jgi:hypothetical protein